MMRCRACNEKIKHLFVSLGSSPLANVYLTQNQLHREEHFYPLDVYLCHRCFLVQLPEFESPETIFDGYAYFSSYSDTWLNHAQDYVINMIDRFGIDKEHFVVEIGSNDGYLLKFFAEEAIPVLGIEPARTVAKAAQEKGIPTKTAFFGRQCAEQLSIEGRRADLLLGNNVLAHVPDLNGFVEGLRILLAPKGLITMEFPHLLRLMEGTQFDTIYHEHFSYFSFLTVEKLFSTHGLIIFDVDELKTHGGSLRIYARHDDDGTKPVMHSVHELRQVETDRGLADVGHYLDFAEKVKAVKRDLLDFLIRAKREGKSIVGYGAPAKGNTLLNYCGIRTDFIDYTVDRNPHKQQRFLPGSHIPIKSPEELPKTKPDYVLILPWNLADEITAQMSMIRNWGGKFVIPIPEPRVF
jgi:SAM-dependent methyltransferase